MIPAKKMEKIIQKFYDEMLESEEFQSLVHQYTQDATNDAVLNSKALEEAFDYLDKQCQLRFKQYLENEEDKNAKKAINITPNDND